MHGRLKVKSSAEQQEEKRLERLKKLAIYQEAKGVVFEKLKNQEYDDIGLNVSQQLLSGNPEFYTLWNFRKQALLRMIEGKEEQDVKAMFEKELPITETCLRANHKSYGAWHHRCWVLDRMPEPNWSKEVDLCDNYLNLDERNFHTWDYRRFVVERARVSAEKELEFTMDKISTNFSNYSSWHYRSKLLPLVYPDKEHTCQLQEDIRLKEFELVQNAVFTDPNDQSAWFYHRWLLGRGERPLELTSLYANYVTRHLIATVSKSVIANSKGCRLRGFINGKEIEAEWQPSNVRSNFSTVWVLQMPESGSNRLDVRIVLETEKNNSQLEITLKDGEEESWYPTSHDPLFGAFRSELSTAAIDVMNQELESCQQLQELEPDNKWTLLNSVLLMYALDLHKHMAAIRTSLAQLIEIDPLRKNYYLDLRSKVNMEEHIAQALPELDPRLNKIELVDCNLTALYHLDRLVFAASLDVSNNRLRSLHSVHVLKALRVLLADSNELSSCEGLDTLPVLQHLSLLKNRICTEAALEPLFSIPTLQYVNIHGNPVCLKTGLQLWLNERKATLELDVTIIC